MGLEPGGYGRREVNSGLEGNLGKPGDEKTREPGCGEVGEW